MPEKKKCPSCGATLPNDLSGLCAACFLAVGLEAGSAEEGTANPHADIHLEKPGDTIGHYKLLEQIGEGGCGVVYLAEQTEPVHRRVALKVVKLGMDTKQVITRFEAERQALALLDHPNICKIFDAGATDRGRPFFVMELVQGAKITDFCDQHTFSTRLRLALFVQVCHAVQHAHQKGIIHRDLKPSNILVTEQDGKPFPKIIDFGIAKATTASNLTDHTFFTALGQFIGTPAYMSPEQAGLGGLDIDTRSDIYSLGVLLYELLTGSQPFDASELRHSAFDEVLRIIREKEPPRPSARLTTLSAKERAVVAGQRMTDPARIARSIHGDVDWIVMKTLEKDRERRYETAESLLRDIDCFLNNEPVTARPPGNLYRLQKWARRNTLTFASLTIVFASLMAAVLISTWMYSKERDSHRRAEAQTQRALLAETDAREQLWRSQLSEARADRSSHRAGRRGDSLALLKKAAAYRPSLALRNEAIACLALTDLSAAAKFTNDLAGSTISVFDGSFERCAIAGENGDVRVRDTQSGQELMLLPGTGSSVSDLVFSPDNQVLGVIYGVFPKYKHGLQIWDLKSRRIIAVEPAITNCRTFTFSSDSTKLVVAQFPHVIGETPEPILLYDLPSGKQIKSFPTASLPWELAFDSSGLKLAISSAEAKNVILRDITTGQVIWSLAHPTAVYGVAWNAEGSLLAAACADGNIYLWEMITGGLVETLSQHQSAAIRVAFNQHGNLLASTGWDGRLRLWNVSTGDEICNWPFEWEQYHVKFSSDSHGLHLYGGNKHTLFKVDGNDETNVLKFISTGGHELWNCAYSADGQVLATPHPDGVRLWDIRSGKLIGFQAVNDVDIVVFDRLGKFLFADCGTGLLRWPTKWSIEGATNKLILGPMEYVSQRYNFDRFCRPFDQRPTTAALVSGQKVYLVDLASRREKNVLGSSNTVDYAALSNNGRWCAVSAYVETNTTIFDVSNSNGVKTLPVALQTKTLAFSPNDRCLVTGDTQQYQLWDTANWSRKFSLPRDQTGGKPGATAFSSDSLTVAVASSAQLVRLVDIASGAELATLESSAPQDIAYIEFSPDGSQLAVIGGGHTHYIQLWDLRLLRRELAAMNLDW